MLVRARSTKAGILPPQLSQTCFYRLKISRVLSYLEFLKLDEADDVDEDSDTGKMSLEASVHVLEHACLA